MSFWDGTQWINEERTVGPRAPRRAPRMSGALISTAIAVAMIALPASTDRERDPRIALELRLCGEQPLGARPVLVGRSAQEPLGARS